MTLRLRRSAQRPSDRWRSLTVAPRGSTKLGFSFRLPQAELMGLGPREALGTLLELGFDTVRLAALWDRIEPAPGVFDPSSVDWQLEAAARRGVDVILALGPIKNFGYPELYVPAHHLPQPLPEGRLVTIDTHRRLAEAAHSVLRRLVECYRDMPAIKAWQVEHEAVDPLGLEHSWRLARDFVAREVEVVRSLDPGRPIVLNGFLPMSRPVALQQRWRSRDQGDSLALAHSEADIVGLDVYPCHALIGAGDLSLYLAASGLAATDRVRSAIRGARRAMVTEGQAEPWEAVTSPPNPAGRVTVSCPPERLIANYNLCLAAASGASLEAYLFWGAEYWLLRQTSGDSSYLGAADRALSS